MKRRDWCRRAISQISHADWPGLTFDAKPDSSTKLTAVPKMFSTRKSRPTLPADSPTKLGFFEFPPDTTPVPLIGSR
jgi:hypothetical protein